MKKLVYLVLAFAGFVFISCDKDEVGGTATESLAGEWVVTADQMVNDTTILFEDGFGVGKFKLYTYNTSNNTSTQMWIDDMKNFWDFKVKVGCDAQGLTFSSDTAVANVSYDCKVVVTGGKILPGAATTPSGTKADSIVFFVSFDDDGNAAKYGYATHKIAGYRYTGLTVDD